LLTEKKVYGHKQKFYKKEKKRNIMFDMITMGDVTIDNYFIFQDASVQCKLKKRDCVLQLRYADKIAVEKFDKFTAGNAANNAIGSARLGMKTALYAEVGNDTSGKELIQTMRKEKVNTQYMKQNKDQQTNISAVLSFQGERTIMVYHAERDYKLPQLTKTQWIYLTSMGPHNKQLKGFHKECNEYIEKHTEIKVGFNPGTHQMKLPKNMLKDTCSNTECLSLNVEEAEQILNKKNKSIHEYLEEFHTWGVKMVVITDGPKGSYGSNGLQSFHCKIFPAPIVDRLGCGDSYTTAVIAALHNKQPLQEAMVWGSINSASVIQYFGPQPGLLTKNALTRIRNNNKKFKANVYA